MKQKQHQKKHVAMIRRILLAVLGILLGLNVYYANANALANNKLPMPLGFGAAIVLSGSMEPTLRVNDVIIVVEAETYEVDDIVVFESGRDLIVHRIIKKNGDTLVTKGEANNTADDPISVKSVKGKVVFSIPYAGYAVEAIRSPVGVIVIILVAILLTEGSFLRKKENDNQKIEEIKEEIRRLKEEQTDEKEEHSADNSEEEKNDSL